MCVLYLLNLRAAHLKVQLVLRQNGQEVRAGKHHCLSTKQLWKLRLLLLLWCGDVPESYPPSVASQASYTSRLDASCEGVKRVQSEFIYTGPQACLKSKGAAVRSRPKKRNSEVF